MDRLLIEPLGGLAGFGGPRGSGGPKVKARGEVALSALSPADQAAVQSLFVQGSQSAPQGAGDMIRYRITRQTQAGSESVEVPDTAVPAALRNSVKLSLE
jgi:hypothetical protein